MTREIKFRVWNTDLLKWERFLTASLEINLNNLKPWFTVMQFTGLKDKNGKEIYEGDILGVIDNKGRETFGVVEFGKHSWGLLYHKGDKIIYTRLRAFLEIEIAGNQFENPELLK